MARLQKNMRSSRSAAWTLFIHPRTEGRVLLIAKGSCASVFILARFFSEVHLLIEKESSRGLLDSIYSAFTDRVKVHLWQDVERLVHENNYETVVIDNVVTGFGEVHTRKLCEKIGQQNTGKKEVVILSRNPIGLGFLMERVRLKFWERTTPIPQEGMRRKAIHNILLAFGAERINRYKLYPNANTPREILGNWAGIPINRRGLKASLLHKMWAIEGLHNGYLHIGTYGEFFPYRSYMDEVLNNLTKSFGAGYPLTIMWLRCMETGSIIVDLGNSVGQRAILKVQMSTGSRKSAQSHRESIQAFVARYPWASAKVPKKLAEGEFLGVHYLLENKIAGVPGQELLNSSVAV